MLPKDNRYSSAVRVRQEMIKAEREELLDWRDSRKLPDASLRSLQCELDHGESLLRRLRPARAPSAPRPGWCPRGATDDAPQDLSR